MATRPTVGRDKTHSLNLARFADQRAAGIRAAGLHYPPTPTLVIGVPKSRTPPSTSFEEVSVRKIGDAYGLTSDEAAELGRTSGWGVIVLDKQSRPPKRADGKLLFIESVPTDTRFPPAPGKTRCDVHMADLKSVPYRSPYPHKVGKFCKDGSPWLNHSGVAILR
jgi:hypothetical protein